MPSTATDRLNGLTTSVAVKPPCITVALSNITLAGLQTISSVAVAEDDRVLVTAQTDASENGIYNASTGDWTRAKDFDGNRDVVQGTIVLVRSGAADGAIFEVTSANPIIIGTSDIVIELRDDPAITYAQTPAEISGSVTPSNTSYLPDIPVRDLRRDGVSKSGTASANYTGIMKAIDWAVARSGGIIRLPDGQVPFNGKITIPTAVVLEGETMGFGSNVSTVLYYTGSGIAIQVDGYYSRLKDFTLKQAGTGTVGVFVTATQFMMDRVTIVPDASTGFSDAGYQTDPSGVTFTHLLNRVYIYGCEIGVDFTWGNNFVLSECFIESCDTDVRVGWAGLVTNFVCGNGSVIELFGDGRGAESNASICLDLVNVKAFSLIDSYLEVNGTGTVGAAGQVGVNLRADAKGGKIARNWFYGGGQALTAINAQDGSVVSVDDNYFQSFNGYAITEVAGARVIAGPGNQYAVGTGIVDRDEAPSPTGLTVVNGTGGATYALNWDLVGNYVHFTLNINVTGDCTTASVAGTTYFPLAGAMLAPIAEGQCTATRQDFVALTGSTHVGGVATNSRIYTPTWTAVNASIRVRGSYRWR